MRNFKRPTGLTGKQAIGFALLCLSVSTATTSAAGTAEEEAAAGFALIAPSKARDQQFEGWNRLRNAGARGNVEALHWSAAHDFETCKARYSAPGTYRKTCADDYSTLVRAASRFCARGTEQDLRFTLPYRVALEEHSRGQDDSAKMWHLINLRFCAKADEHYPKEIVVDFSAMEAAEVELKTTGISPER